MNTNIAAITQIARYKGDHSDFNVTQVALVV